MIALGKNIELLDELGYFELIDEAINAMVSSVGDTYTSYVDSEDTSEFNDKIKGREQLAFIIEDENVLEKIGKEKIESIKDKNFFIIKSSVY